MSSLAFIKMSVKQERYCRLCLKAAKSGFEEISKITMHMLAILFLKVDLDITKDCVVCQDCIGIAKKCLNFKRTCIDTEKIILLFSVGRKDTKHDIKVVYNETELVQTVVNGDLDICRFCITPVNRRDSVLLDVLKKETIFEMLSVYMPEVDFNIIENPFMCATCRESIDNYFKFARNCLYIEEQIKAYNNWKGSDNIDQVELSNIVHFSFNDVLEPAAETYGGFIKYEELAIKEENMNLDKNSYKNGNKSPKKKTKICQRTSEHKEKNGIDSKKTYKCSICSYEGTGKRKLKIHMIVHKEFSDAEIYKCTLCAFKAKRKNSLKLHMLVHKDVSEVKMYKCSLCAFEAKRRGYLTKHMLVHKDMSEVKIYKCSLCAFEAKRRNRLTKHMLVHKDISEVEAYECSLCAYKAKRKGCLVKHMFVHKETKLYKCSLCPYEAKRRNYFTKHNMAVHKDSSEIYTCPLCTFQAKGKRCLKLHMLVHKDVSEINTYKCSLCAYETERKDSLVKHVLVHKNPSEIEMHKCSLCDFETKRKGSLAKHMLRHKDFSEIRTYKCSLCAYEGKLKAYFTRHMLIHKDLSK